MVDVRLRDAVPESEVFVIVRGKVSFVLVDDAASGGSPPKAASFSAVMLGVLLRSVLVMLGRVQGMPMRDL